jgi:hypothetical protein
VSFKLLLHWRHASKQIKSVAASLGILLLSILPPLILLFGASLNQEVNCFDDGNFEILPAPFSTYNS